MIHSNKGFTLIELVIVIVLLSILGVLALPRFVETDKKAHEALVGMTGSAFSAAVALVQAQWIANADRTDCTDVTGFGDSTIDVTSNGYAMGTGGASCAATPTMTTATCLQVYDALMQSSRPLAAVAAATGVDFLITVSTPTCTFTYQKGGTMAFTYNAETGVVTIDDTF